MEQDVERRLINILRKAIQSERIAYKRYTLAGTYALSEDEKKMFQTLAEEELKHEEMLMARMRELKKAIGLEVIKKGKEKEAAPKETKKTKKKKKE